MKYGAQIERGRIKKLADNGYEVESLERIGIVTPPIPTMGNKQYTVGDMVYFFLFDDGTGMIICNMN